MSATCVYSPIRLLSPQLADQIAAGEVIERPASVLKELIENSLDAGAKRIEVELLNGGMNLIRVTDDGYGIAPDELTLAISRHATSKIAEQQDLLALQSLGFRGEALASICSVSEWELLSRRAGEPFGARLSDRQAQQGESVAHAVGTTVSIKNLFYNIPARRKFLRSEATEYRYCEDVLMRMALSRVDVGFYLQHNQRMTYRLPAAVDEVTKTRRVTQLLGESFIQQAVMIDYAHQGLRLSGWLSLPGYSRQQNDLQYFYINQRVVRDRIINHAVRQAYQDQVPPGRHPAYVLYLALDPRAVDVNVHPTKYEVRFHESRHIHDFLLRCIRESLQRSVSASPFLRVTDLSVNEIVGQQPFRVADEQGIYTTPPIYSAPLPGQLLWHRYFLEETAEGLWITDLVAVRALALREQLINHVTQSVVSRPLLIPAIITLSAEHMQRYTQWAEYLSKLGWDISITGPVSLMVRAVPARIVAAQAEALLRHVVTLSANDASENSLTVLIERIYQFVLQDRQPIDAAQLAGLLRDAKYLASVRSHFATLVTPSQFTDWLTSFKRSG